MKSLSEELKNFSTAKLRKQTTRVTTATGKIFTEKRDGNEVAVGEENSAACGYVQDLSLDLQVGTITPYLLISSQDVASDIETLRHFKVTHILNVAYGVENVFPEHFTYKTVHMMDLPETKLTSYFPQCFEFIDQARKQEDGVVLLHCNAGVSRSASIAIAYLMTNLRMSFAEAFKQVKTARPSIQPNPGFLTQLQQFQP